MGLEDFQTKSSDRHRVYGSHEYDEQIEKAVDKYRDRFPIDLEIEFTEISSRMSKCFAKAYKKGSKYYIRVSEDFIDKSGQKEVELTVLHEMVHVYLYQKGFPQHDHDKYFRWILGRVGGSMTGMTIHEYKWQECIEPFLEMEGEEWD